MLAPPPVLPVARPIDSLVNVAPASYAGADVMLRAALVTADGRNVVLHGPDPCAAELYVYDADDGSAAFGAMPGCAVYVDRAHRDAWWSQVNDRNSTTTDRRDVLVQVCGVLAHERLHNRGFGHSEHGIMAPVLTTKSPTCVRWARSYLRTKGPTHA